ncbi:MAG: vWA domain-containing protein [Spirochaetota bacterium]
MAQGRLGFAVLALGLLLLLGAPAATVAQVDGPDDAAHTAATSGAAPEREPAGSPERTTSALSLQPEDVRIDQTIEGGYYLHVRNREGLGSILLTESTERSDHEVATYAYRNPAWHPENGDERRVLDGEFLDVDGVYSLVDSTPVADEEFGEAYRIFIPYVVVYGYEWSRSGELQVLDGTYLSIRAFEKPYADYSGGYRDNPFILRVSQRERVTETPEYMPEAVDRLREIAEENGGDAVESETDEDVVDTIERIIAGAQGRSVDLVLALDTTQSMEDNVPHLQASLVPMLEEFVEGSESLRVGLVYYRDYMEEYLTRRFDFQDDFAFVQRAIDTVRVAGGRDIPEAVYEALYAAVTRYVWTADERHVVLVGDAPPHPHPRGAVTRELVQAEAERRGVRIHTIILPQ